MSTDNLSARHCWPMRGSEHQLPAAELQSYLDQLEGWSLIDDGTALSRSFGFADYFRTMAFVNALAYIAHREDHHPDLGVHYNRCVVRFSTHDAGGVTMNDIICAAKANALYAERSD